MSSTTELQENRTHATAVDIDNTSEKISHQALNEEAPSLHDCKAQKPARTILEYLLDEVPEFRRLSDLRKKVRT